MAPECFATLLNKCCFPVSITSLYFGGTHSFDVIRALQEVVSDQSDARLGFTTRTFSQPYIFISDILFIVPVDV